MERSIVENVTLPHLAEVSTATVIDGRRERREAETLMKQVDVRAASPSAPVTTLGREPAEGALRQVAVQATAAAPRRRADARCRRRSQAGDLCPDPIPGRGWHGGARDLVRARGGDRLAHRVLVMRQGRIVAEFDGHDVTEDDVLSAAFATEAGRAS